MDVVPPSLNRRRIAGAAVPLVPACLLLGFGAVQLSQRLPLWYDESYTALAVQVPVSRVMSSLWHHTGLVTWLSVPPSFNAPYYVVMHLWCALFGTSALALRVPSLLCAAVAVALTAVIVRRLAGPLPGLVAGLICASGPLLAQEAVEARSYGAAMAATAAVVWLLLRRADGMGGRRWLLGVAAGAAGLLHWFTLPVLLCLAAADLVVRRRRAMHDAVVLVGSLVPAFALVLLSLAGHSTGAPSPAQQGLRLPWRTLRDWALGSMPLVVVLLVALVVAIVRSPRRGLVVAWLVAPVLVVTGIDCVRPVYFPRYMLFALLGLGAAAGLAVATVRARMVQLAAAAALLATSTYAMVPALSRTPRERPDAVVKLLLARQQPGQPIVPVDGRAAVEVVEAARRDAPRLTRDLLLRPVRVPVAGPARSAWLIRSGHNGSFETDVIDESNLQTGHWTLQQATVFHGSAGDLVVQHYTR